MDKATMRQRRFTRSRLVVTASLLVIGVAVFIWRNGPQQGTTLGLSDYDGAAEGSALDDGQAFFSYSIRPLVESGIEIISAEPVGVEGPVEVDGVFVLELDHPFVPNIDTATDSEIQAMIDRHRADQVFQVRDCERDPCQIVFAIVARRVSSETDGVVRGIEVHYRQNGREYVERTKFAVGLCLPDNFEDCTLPA